MKFIEAIIHYWVATVKFDLWLYRNRADVNRCKEGDKKACERLSDSLKEVK